MQTSVNIRALYKPVQPSAAHAGAPVHYQELLPDSLLLDYIYCYWELKTTSSLESALQYRVVADGCIDIFFDINNTSDSSIMGFCKTHTQFPLDGRFHYVGIRFLPTIFPQLFRVNAAALSGRVEQLDAITPPLAAFIRSRVHGALGMVGIQQLLDNYFVKMLIKAPVQTDNRLNEAMAIILKSCGMLHTGKHLDTGVSPRQLRRLFELYIGDTPKVFSKIVRFQHALRLASSASNLRTDKPFFNCGYYDQAHFIKDFKQMYGATPSQAFRK
ncbi:MAG: AraC family transcriptional regulator [Chitinophagaceae bacterium]|nr:AraC family transcriptional regulator [Chitinophagaceae bacterium]